MIAIEAGQQGPLERVHDGPLVRLGNVGLLERQHPRRVPLGVLAGVDQRFGLVGVAAQQFGPVAVSVAA